ncbi:MAG: hypothetical protein JWQ09_5948 [Segetibacter sp.]|nr:hypothetical protein [Segetibacter sp.]
MEVVVEIQLFPCINFIKKLIKHKHIKIEKYERFQKMSFRNRYVIAGANGLTNLTIPVAGGREQKALITEVEIDNTIDWRTKHWRSLTSAYSKAPFFDYYTEEVKAMLFNSEKSLFEINLFILTTLCKLLTINPFIEFTEKYESVNEDVDYRNKFLPGNFQAHRDKWQPRYSQVFEDRLGFQPNLSILDLLFCEGPNSIYLLEQSVRDKE